MLSILVAKLNFQYRPTLNYEMIHSPALTSIGLPPGVCNMVFGTGPKAGEAIVTHPDVSAISFTGSTATGERIQRVSAPYCKKLSLEVSLQCMSIRVQSCVWMYMCMRKVFFYVPNCFPRGLMYLYIYLYVCVIYMSMCCIHS